MLNFGRYLSKSNELMHASLYFYLQEIGKAHNPILKLFRIPDITT